MAKQARSKITRERFLDAAATEFAERGYPDTSLQDVIARTGLTKGALYGHFLSKRHLAAVLTGQLDEVLGLLLDGEGDGDGDRGRPGSALERLRTLSCSLAERIGADVRFDAGVRLALDAAQWSPERPKFVGQVRYTARQLVEQAQREGELSPSLAPAPLTDLIVVMLVGAYCTAPAADRRDLSARVREMWDVLLPALRCQAGG